MSEFSLGFSLGESEAAEVIHSSLFAATFTRPAHLSLSVPTGKMIVYSDIIHLLDACRLLPWDGYKLNCEWPPRSNRSPRHPQIGPALGQKTLQVFAQPHSASVLHFVLFLHFSYV